MSRSLKLAAVLAIAVVLYAMTRRPEPFDEPGGGWQW